MITSEGLLVDAAITLQKAGPAGMPLADLARALWPDAGVRAHGAVGGVLRELERRGVVSLSPGGKRRRAALTDAGREWIATYSIEGAALDAELVESYQPRFQPPAPPPPPRVKDPVELAIDEASKPEPCPPWMGFDQAYALGTERGRRDVERLRAACGANQPLFMAALAEVDRRQQARIAELEQRIRAGGGDPSPVGFRARAIAAGCRP